MSRTIRFPRTGAALGAAALVLPLAAACSGSSEEGSAGATTAPPTTMAASAGGSAPGSASTRPATTTTGAPAAPAPTRCPTSALRLETVEQGASAGHSHSILVFTNAGAGPCTLEGYPGVSFLGADGTPVGKPAERLENPTASVRLAPGEQAHASINVSNAYNFGEECGETLPATTLRVFPPDETADLRAPFTTQVCRDLAMAHVGPVFPGAAVAADENAGA